MDTASKNAKMEMDLSCSDEKESEDLMDVNKTYALPEM